MPKTEQLQLPLVTDDSTLFEDWRKSINGAGESAFKIIDDFAIEVLEALSSGGETGGDGSTLLDMGSFKDTGDNFVVDLGGFV